MKTSMVILTILIILSALLLLLIRRFDQRYYAPFLKTFLKQPTAEPRYNPKLLNRGLMVAGLGLAFYAALGIIFRGLLLV